jgi:uncharacterized protein YggE
MVAKQLILLVVLFFTSLAQVTLSPTYIQPPQFSLCSTTSQCCDANTITVYGSATIQVAPDQALLDASLSVNANTVQQAVSVLAS